MRRSLYTKNKSVKILQEASVGQVQARTKKSRNESDNRSEVFRPYKSYVVALLQFTYRKLLQNFEQKSTSTNLCLIRITVTTGLRINSLNQIRANNKTIQKAVVIIQVEDDGFNIL